MVSPFGPTMKIFYRRLYMKRCIFCHFPARITKFNNVWWSFVFPNFRKMGEFAVFIEHSEAKSVSASGGRSPPDPPTTGSAPGPCWGLRPQTPVIRSCSARSPWPPLWQILNTPLTATTTISQWKAVKFLILKKTWWWNWTGVMARAWKLSRKMGQAKN